MTVVVGVDGSPQSLTAVRAAALEANWRDRPLRIVHAFIWPLLHVPVGPSEGGPPESGLRHAAEAILKEAADAATQACPSVKLITDLVPGAALPVLLNAAHDAELVVIGDRGLGGFTGLLVGSVAVGMASYATVPLLVVKGNPAPGGPVVVGVDGSDGSQAALECAFQEASLRGAELVVVHAWTGPVSTGPGDMLPLVYDVAEVAGEEERVVAEALAGHRERYPEVTVRSTLERRRASRALIGHTAAAQLIVVGSRGRGGFAGLLLGSVSQQVLHHAECPVLIARKKA